MQVPKRQDEPKKKGAPRYMSAYCSIMTLLLAFFIILQTFAKEQQSGFFYAGRGSFVRALETFGLGGVWDRMGGGVGPGEVIPHYRSSEGEDDPPDMRRIDPEHEDAQRALQSLEEEFNVQEPKQGTGWRVTLPTPFSYETSEDEFGPEYGWFCERLASCLEPLVSARGFVIRVGALLDCPEQEEVAQTRRALQTAHEVRRRIIDSMSPRAQKVAGSRLYSYCRTAAPRNDGTTAAPAQLRVDIMLTKPYVRKVEEQGASADETDETS